MTFLLLFSFIRHLGTFDIRWQYKRLDALLLRVCPSLRAGQQSQQVSVTSDSCYALHTPRPHLLPLRARRLGTSVHSRPSSSHLNDFCVPGFLLIVSETPGFTCAFCDVPTLTLPMIPFLSSISFHFDRGGGDSQPADWRKLRFL